MMCFPGYIATINLLIFVLKFNKETALFEVKINASIEERRSSLDNYTESRVDKELKILD
jgi:hypothetical protein